MWTAHQFVIGLPQVLDGVLTAAGAVWLLALATAGVLVWRAWRGRSTPRPHWFDRLADRIGLPPGVLATVLAGIAGAATAALAGVLLAGTVMDRGGPLAVDRAVLTWLAERRSPELTGSLRVLTLAGNTVVLGVLATITALILLRRGDRQRAALVVVVTGSAALLVVATKNLVGRVRPPAEGRLVAVANESFPSAHALGSTAVYGVLTVVLLRHVGRAVLRLATVAVAVLLVAVVGFSRLYLGVHWLTDIAGGWLLGGALLVVCWCGLTALSAGVRPPADLRSI